ncbi:hypothetical protein [Haloarcula mannanilytica]|nr:hypothetical protein [Haloarcula mannanilytica]
MKRRRFLQCGGFAGAAAVAGCLGTGPGNEESPTDGAGEAPGVTETAFSVTKRTAGTQANTATVSFDGARVVVEGTIWGANGCKTAELTDAVYDADADELTVAVGTTDMPDAGDMCTQAVMEINYRAVVTLANGRPGTVVVTHDSGDGPTDVATATR